MGAPTSLQHADFNIFLFVNYTSIKLGWGKIYQPLVKLKKKNISHVLCPKARINVISISGSPHELSEMWEQSSVTYQHLFSSSAQGSLAVTGTSTFLPSPSSKNVFLTQADGDYHQLQDRPKEEPNASVSGTVWRRVQTEGTLSNWMLCEPAETARGGPMDSSQKCSIQTLFALGLKDKASLLDNCLHLNSFYVLIHVERKFISLVVFKYSAVGENLRHSKANR